MGSFTFNYSIPYLQAHEWAQRWAANASVYLATTKLTAFAIPRQVINDVIAPADVVDVRVYLGLDHKFNPHLMVVGMDADGNDIHSDGQHLIYNFARPCPSSCTQGNWPKIA